MGGGAFYQFMDGGALWLHLTGLPVSGWWHLVSGRVTRQARELERPLMVRVGCRGSEDGNAAVSPMSEGRVLAGWIASLSAAWSRGKLDFGSSSLILSLFMHLFHGGLHYFLVCILIIFYL